MKIWEKGLKTSAFAESFTVGDDQEVDLLLAPFDVFGSLAHVKMLEEVELITSLEHNEIKLGLLNILDSIQNGQFEISDDCEDVHSQIEFMLIKSVGEAGKKIHMARSRNDQVLLDLKLYSRMKIQMIVLQIETLFNSLILKSEEGKDEIIPGYTHLQVAMPSSFGLFFGAYAEALVDDVELLKSAFQLVNRNPLGSGAGYGSSFPISRTRTTEMLAFDGMNINSIYAQMTRGKMEKIVLNALSILASTISKLASDLCLFNCQNFNFVEIPSEFTTGSSIMPHKKNPDVLEIIRGKCNKISALSTQVDLITRNMTSGYFRDYQMIKKDYLNSFDVIASCIDAMNEMIHQIKLNISIVNDTKYDSIYSVELVNEFVSKGMPFRDSYKKVSSMIEDGTYKPLKDVCHTHEGSIGNLMNEENRDRLNALIKSFEFQRIESAYQKLVD